MMIRDPYKREVARTATRLGTALSGVAVVMTVLGMAVNGVPVASAATNAGAAVMVPPGSSTPLTAGGSATAFTLELPAGAGCTGDSANDGYRVQSYMVSDTVDPNTLTFGSTGPLPSSFGAHPFRQPLYDQTSSTGYVDAQTANRTNAGDPGPVVNIATFSFEVFTPGDVPAGTYNVGIACTLGPASPTQLDKYWNTTLTVVADGNDEPAGITWSTNPPATTTSSTSSTTSTTSSTSTSSTTAPTSTTSSTTSSTSSTSSTTSTTAPTSTTSSTTSTTAPTSTTSSTTSTTAPVDCSTATTTTSTTPPATCVPAGTTSSSSAAVGGGITVSSDGWKPDSAVTAVLNSDPVALGTLTASSTGVISATLTVPASVTPGAHQLVLTGADPSDLVRTVRTQVTIVASSTTATTAPTGSTLPRTGSSLLPLVMSSALLIAFGGATLLLRRSSRLAS